MIPNTPLHHGLIRLTIWALRAVTPASFALCLAASLGQLSAPWPLQAVAAAEVVFYCCISLPRQYVLRRSEPRFTPRSHAERQALWTKMWTSVPNVETFLSVWFRGAPLDSIGHDNVKDLLAWAFLCKTRATTAEEDDELEEYVCRVESRLGRPFLPGRGRHAPSQVSTDPLRLQHKPLLFYLLAIGTVDLLTCASAWQMGLEHYRLSLRESWAVFPPRLHTLCSRHTSPSRHVSYMYRPHTSPTRLPVLLIHGIGVGLHTYMGFLRDFIDSDPADDGQTGILAIELMPISMRISKAMPPRQELVADILAILRHHGWDRFVLVGHSYGTIIAAHILHQQQQQAQEHGHADRVGPLMLIDPVTLSIHWGDIPYSFIYRQPQKASEWQLHYFASTEMCVAHSISRNFDWTENVLWPAEMEGDGRLRRVTVALASDDIIVDTHALRTYLESTSGEHVHVVWYEGLNHASVFDSAVAWQPLLDILHQYCTRS